MGPSSTRSAPLVAVVASVLVGGSMAFAPHYAAGVSAFSSSRSSSNVVGGGAVARRIGGVGVGGISSSTTTRNGRRRAAGGAVGAAPVSMGLGVALPALKWALALPTMYGLMSVNEYFTHRYYQHAEYNKDKFFQALAKTFNLPRRIRGGGHVEHHAETYDDMLLKTDDPNWMRSPAAKSLNDDPWRGTAFTWKVTGQMTLQMLFTTLPTFMGVLRFSFAQTIGILLPCMLMHALVWNALHPGMHGLPDVPLSVGAPSSTLAPFLNSWYFRYLYQVS
jgi:hypothetical protein